MKEILLVLFICCALACNKSRFEVDPNEIYSPSRLVKDAGGKCNTTQPWEGKTVRVAGRIDQPALYETRNGGKFWLLDEKGFIEIYVQQASNEQLTAIYHKVIKGSSVTITGKAIAAEIDTQLKCRKKLYITIERADAIAL